MQVEMLEIQQKEILQGLSQQNQSPKIENDFMKIEGQIDKIIEICV